MRRGIGFRDKNSKCSMVVKSFKRDTQIYFKNLYAGKIYGDNGGNKKDIYEFSDQSSRRLRLYLRNSFELWKAMITLTYPAEYPCDGGKVKIHIDNFCHWLRTKKIKYFWILEFQRRGAPHFHFLTSEPIEKEIVSRKWFEVVGSGDENHLLAGTRCDTVRNENHLMGYVVGYMKKLGYQKKAPEGFENVGRWWGCTRKILEHSVRVFSGDYSSMSREIRDFRHWNARHLKKFGIKWRWNGHGFTGLDGTPIMQILWASKRIPTEKGSKEQQNEQKDSE